MARLAVGFLLLLLLLRAREALSDLGTGPHITEVNILLPPMMTRPVEYRLQGSDGCFKWYVCESEHRTDCRVGLRNVYFCVSLFSAV